MAEPWTKGPKVTTRFYYPTGPLQPLWNGLDGAVWAAIRDEYLLLRDVADMEEDIQQVELPGRWFEYYPKVSIFPTSPNYWTDADIPSLVSIANQTASAVASYLINDSPGGQVQPGDIFQSITYPVL